ncbi:hypothetical protein SLW70_10610 [Flavobacterium sp. NG2]|nr:hypothetical protein [Flavobacterium sp. NG2]WPR70393.1 hypothetical protein SLW70_10610 [Flavobacterium sp. NG2]
MKKKEEKDAASIWARAFGIEYTFVIHFKFVISSKIAQNENT